MRSPPWLRSAIGVSLAVLIVAAPLAIGSVHMVTRLVLAVAVALVAAATLVERRLTGKRLPIAVPTVALGCAVVFTLLGLIPLPPGLLAHVAPATFATLDATRDRVPWHATSMDPPGTFHELIKLAAYLAFFVAIVTYASRRHRKQNIVFAVVGAAALVTLIGFVQAIAGARKILFFYEPSGEWGTLVRGTFVNPNHFGALLCLAAPCALAVGLREARWRWIALPVTVALNVAIVLSLARASLIAALLGQIVTFGLDRLQLRHGSDWTRDGRHPWRALAVAVAAAMAGTIVIALHVVQPTWTTSISGELGDPHSKFQAWRDSVRLILEQPWVGVGRGAFEQAFTRVSSVGGQIRYPWIESGYVQSAVDWGVPAALLLCTLAGWSLVVAIRRLGEDPLSVGSLGAIVALAVHETVDFAVEMPGVALPALAVLGTLYSRRQSESEPGRRRIRVQPAFFLLPIALAAAALLAGRFPSAQTDVDRLTARARDASTPLATVVALGEAARDRHPAEYRLPALVAERLARDRDGRALRWLNDAIFLHPTHPTLHLLAAEILAAAGRKAQALLEYRTAAEHATNPRTAIWPAVAKRYPAFPDLRATCPNDVDHLWIFAKWLTGLGRGDDAQAVHRDILAQDPSYLPSLQWLVEHAIDLGDTPQAQERVRALLAVDRSPPSRLLAIRTAILAGDLEGAARDLDGESGRNRDVFDVEVTLARALAAAAKVDASRARLEHVEKTWPLTRELRIILHETRAEIERQAGNQHQYRWELEQRDRLKNPQF